MELCNCSGPTEPNSSSRYLATIARSWATTTSATSNGISNGNMFQSIKYQAQVTPAMISVTTNNSGPLLVSSITSSARSKNLPTGAARVIHMPHRPQHTAKKMDKTTAVPSPTRWWKISERPWTSRKAGTKLSLRPQLDSMKNHSVSRTAPSTQIGKHAPQRGNSNRVAKQNKGKHMVKENPITTGAKSKETQ